MKLVCCLLLALLPAILAFRQPVGGDTPGGKKDDHGCIGSAGYMWCEKEEDCVRPWELAKEKGFALTPVTLDGYCNGEHRGRDEHGCIGSAGYKWCEREQTCVRGWELAKEKNFEFTAENFDEYCNATVPMPGSDQDEHGCIGTAGYRWCEFVGACVRFWEIARELNLKATPEAVDEYCNKPRVGGDKDEHGCIGSAGYMWCARENKCVKIWELAQLRAFDLTPAAISGYCDGSQRLGAEKDEHGCIGSAGYMWCENAGKCVRPWELAAEANFELTPEGLDGFCNGEVRLGESDEHGCISGAGYMWCEKEGVCVRAWELARDREIEYTPESIQAYCQND